MDYETILVVSAVAVITSAITAYITTHFKIREEKEKWRRKFVFNYAEAKANNPILCSLLAEQFAVGILKIEREDPIGHERIFLPSNCRRVVGRGDEINIDNDFVSRKHAAFSADKSNVYIEDLGSTNGTLLNGKKVSSKCKLKSGDVIKIGNTKIIFEPVVNVI